MVFDRLKNAHLYYGLGPRFERALKFLKETPDLLSKEAGRYPIDGDDIFYLVRRYDSFRKAECKLENHLKYADIQYVLSGREYFGFVNVEGLRPKDPHSERDVYFFEDPGSCANVVLSGDSFVIAFSADAHMPDRAINDIPEPIVKVVVKVRLD